MSTTNPEEEKKVITMNLYKERTSFINIKAKISEIIEPRIFKLLLENISNVRNSIIVSGALATISLVVLSQQLEIISLYTKVFLQISIFGFLIAILTYSLYLDRSLGKGISLYRKKMDENTSTTDKGENAINNCLDGKITKQEMDKILEKVYREIEYDRIRTNPKTNTKDDKLTKYLAIGGNTVFVSGIISLIIAFVFEVFK
ncbi:MAG: hypothetical protein ACD_7C00199G0002 [uncultured bacterium]|nr:MAG: hypothetical protein ACD_7C00199G0002 [uncultured bacterium]